MRTLIATTAVALAILPGFADAAEWRAVRHSCKPTFEGWERTHGHKLETFTRRNPTEIRGTIRWTNGSRNEIVVRASGDAYCVTEQKFLGREVAEVAR